MKTTLSHRLIQRLRTLVMDWFCFPAFSVCGRITVRDQDADICWVDHRRWFLDGKVTTVFGWAWNGSDEEIEAAFNNETPIQYLTERQEAAIYDAYDLVVAHCDMCGWTGLPELTDDGACPECICDWAVHLCEGELCAQRPARPYRDRTALMVCERRPWDKANVEALAKGGAS